MGACANAHAWVPGLHGGHSDRVAVVVEPPAATSAPAAAQTLAPTSAE